MEGSFVNVDKLVQLNAVRVVPALQCHPGCRAQDVLTLTFALPALPASALRIAHERHGHVIHEIRLFSSHALSMASNYLRVTARIW